MGCQTQVAVQTKNASCGRVGCFIVLNCETDLCADRVDDDSNLSAEREN
jgi:hypothetical protein